MAARRCSSCGRNYPTSVLECAACGGSLWWDEEGAPDELEPECDEMSAFLSGSESELWQYRVRRFRKLGFTRQQRIRLANESADWHEAHGLLRRGCPVDVVFDLLSG